MELLRCKARISALWIVMAVGTVASMFLNLLRPGTIEEVMAGMMEGQELSEGMLAFMSLFFVIPIILAILCLTLKGSANRWLNFVFGILWFGWMVFEIVGHMTMGEGICLSGGLMMGTGLVLSAFIPYFAWKLPKEEA